MLCVYMCVYTSKVCTQATRGSLLDVGCGTGEGCGRVIVELLH